VHCSSLRIHRRKFDPVILVMASNAAVQALLHQRLLELLENEMTAMLNSTHGTPSTPSIIATSTKASDTIAILSNNQATSTQLTTGTSSTSASSFSSTTSTAATVSESGAAPTFSLPSRPSTHAGLINPFIVGSLKHRGFTLPIITPAVLRSYSDFYQGIFCGSCGENEAT